MGSGLDEQLEMLNSLDLDELRKQVSKLGLESSVRFTGFLDQDELRERFGALQLQDQSRAFNTEWLTALELDCMIDVARAMAYSAVNLKESRGAHQRLDQYSKRDDENYLKHTRAHYRPGDTPEIAYGDVNITKLPPAERVYGSAAKKTGTA